MQPCVSYADVQCARGPLAHDWLEQQTHNLLVPCSTHGRPTTDSMAWTPAKIHEAIKAADLNNVVFQDPLTDESRKAKRNLLIASFTCLLIAVLKLEVTSFLGLTAGAGVLSNVSVQGLACVVVIYTLIGFCFHVFVDYSAWKFERERLSTEPYLALIKCFGPRPAPWRSRSRTPSPRFRLCQRGN
jgi:hypothetical protein